MPLRERRQVETVKNLLCDCLILLANTDRHLVEDIAYGSIMKAPPQYLIFRHTEIFAAEGQFACRVDIEELGARILEDDADIPSPNHLFRIVRIKQTAQGAVIIMSCR